MASNNCITSCVINDRLSIKKQFLISYSIISIITGGITLAICYGLLYRLAETSYRSARSTINDQTTGSLLTISTEISSAINQQLLVVSQSIVMSGVLYSQLLINNSITTSLSNYQNTSIFKYQNYYKEYNFVGTCDYPNCPKDYSKLSGKSRFPDLPGFVNGSLSHSSVYIYSSQLGSSIRNDTLWNRTYDDIPQLRRVITSLGYQDQDMQIAYNNGPNTTVMFYVSSLLSDKQTGQYLSIQRTFPGIVKNSTSYIASSRPWFVNAPVNGVYFYGPYIESFTKQLVITLSSKINIHKFTTTYALTLVNAAVLLLDDLKNVVNDIVYPYEGFGSLIKYDTYTVIVWGASDDSPYDATTQSFLTIDSFASGISSSDLQRQGTFEYTDTSGTIWIVASNPFYNNELIMLTFAKKALVDETVQLIRDNINHTTRNTTVITIIICCVIIFFNLVIISFFVNYLVSPLDMMRRLSKDIVKLSVEEEENKDYSNLIEESYSHLNRYDEIGSLSIEYYNVIVKLHNQSIIKKSLPKYTVNPFHRVNEFQTSNPLTSNQPTSSHLVTWDMVHEVMLNQYDGALISPRLTDISNTNKKPNPTVEHDDNDGDLDVLSSISKHKKVEYKPIESNDIELANKKTADNKIVNDIDGKRDIVENHQVLFYQSVKSILFMFSVFILMGIVIVMIVTVVNIDNEGSQWTKKAKVNLLNAEIDVLNAIISPKSKFVYAYFLQYGLELLTATKFLSSLMNSEITNADLIFQGKHKPSYSIDPNNPYSYGDYFTHADFSAYYSPNDKGCNYQECTSTHNSFNVKATSLWDIKMNSLNYYGNSHSFIQFGLEDGLTRYIPFTESTTYSYPTSCGITSTVYSICQNNYQDSSCNPSSSYDPYYYTAYDPRCRSWYEQAVKGSKGKAYFQYPRISSSGKYVITASSPLYNNTNNQLVGVQNINILVQVLSDSINQLKILNNGYSYILDSNNITEVILHPNLPNGCSNIHCAESFSSKEYNTFYDSVLSPLQFNKELTTDFYVKNNEKWFFATGRITYDTFDYVLIVTVPASDIYESSTKITNSINYTVNGMITAFVLVLVVYIVLYILLVYYLNESIITPIIDLKKLLKELVNNNYNVVIPSTTKSYDMKVLLDAIRELVIALRFGNEIYSRGDPMKARDIFTDALNLFVLNHNTKGIGACHNNLGAVEMTVKNYNQSEVNYNESIKIGESLLNDYIKKSKNESTIHPMDSTNLNVVYDKLYRTLSDRKGNLALLYLQSNRYSEAFNILENLLLEDKKHFYIKGCVIKQGTLGHYYLRQNEFKQAWNMFDSIIKYVYKQEDDDAYNTGRDSNQSQLLWNYQEAEVAKQIALYNIALYKEKSNELVDKELEQSYLNALVTPSYIDISTVIKILTFLKKYYQSKQMDGYIQSLDQICSLYHYNIDNNIQTSYESKQVVFCLDYSGSMAGSKIRSANTNLMNIITNNVNESDSIMLIHFDDRPNIDFPLGAKHGRETIIEQSILKLNSPSGSTAMRDAINLAIDSLQINRTSNDWIITLTDGDDNSSHMKESNLTNKITNLNVNVIIIGVGSDVNHDQLQKIVKASKKGMYIASSSDNKGITEAFGKAIEIIQGQVILEDL